MLTTSILAWGSVQQLDHELRSSSMHRCINQGSALSTSIAQHLQICINLVCRQSQGLIQQAELLLDYWYILQQVCQSPCMCTYLLRAVLPLYLLSSQSRAWTDL